MKATPTKKKSPAKKEVKENTFPVVAIGASAGGLEAMMELLKYLPANTGMAFIYVQHLSPDHKSLLTEILSKKTQMIVQEIDDMDLIQPNNVFVIPYNKGIEVTDGHIKLIPRSKTSTTISIDILFSSLAAAQKERVIGIILSGSASDGTIGMKAIKQEGGLTFAQDDTAKFNSMPHSAIAAGTVDFILSPKEIALELGRLSKHPLIKTNGVKNYEEDLIENSDPELKIILNQLHKVKGVDFSVYKMNTVKRRIIRRMLLYKMTHLDEYVKLLSQKKITRTTNGVQSGEEEINILYQDLLINVTSFFRDTDTHKYLKETLFPKLFKRKKKEESLRIWVPACATGEEAYSMAMMLLEVQESKATNILVQIFATDLSDQAISKARIGIYTKHDLETVSPKRIQRFLTKADGGFRVNKVLRDMCVFAPHNILRDPPFSRLDFISCCNLFIYLDIPAQKKAVNTFHYALNDDGFLMLGKSENISHSANLFTGFNKKFKIFSRKANSGTRTLPALLPRYAKKTVTENNITVTNKAKTKQTTIAIGAVNHNKLDNAIDAVLVSEFMPASVVINYHMEIVQFRGTTDLFLTHPKGKATFNILKMARPEIAFELRNAISKVIKTNHRFRKSGIEMKINSAVKIISLEIVPLVIDPIAIGWDEPLLLILFTEQEQTENYSQHAEGGKNTPKAIGAAKERRIKKLEQELAAAHANALAIAQEQEAYTEELQSANEEVVSSNEELQTVNEELETSKEEIESANEELTTTNQELQTRNDLLNEAYGYSEAVFATIHEPMLVLDKNLRVKSANKTFYKIFNVREEETEGVLLYDLGNRQWNIPRLRDLLEDLLPKNTHFHDFEITHTFPVIGKKTMLLNARRIIQKMNHEELILLAIADITEQATARREIEESEARFRSLADDLPIHIFITEPNQQATIGYWNKHWLNYTGQMMEEALGRTWLEIMHPDDVQHIMDVYVQAFEKRQPYFLKGIRIKRYDGEYRWHSVQANPRYLPNGEFMGYIGVGFDIHERKLAQDALKLSEKHFRTMGDLMPAKISNADAAANVTYFNKHWLDFSGYTFEELRDFGYHKIMHPDELEEFQQRLQKAAETGIDSVMEMRFKNKQGDYIWHLNIASPVKDENGKLRMWIGVTTEMQHQKVQREELEHAVAEKTSELSTANESLQSSETRYLQMVNEIQDYAILYLSREGNIENWNAGAQRINGYKAEEIIGKNISVFYNREDRKNKLPEKLIMEAIKNDRTNHEGWRVRKDGSTFWGYTTLTALHDSENNIIGISNVTHDLTDKKKADDLINRANQSLKEKNIELQNINKELESFTFLSSHDLQEPLRKMQTLIGRILEKENSNLSDSGKKYFLMVQNSALRMQTLIQDLLAFSRISVAERQFEVTDLNIIIEDVKHEFKDALKEKQAIITVNEMCNAKIIPFQFRQLMHNLISNALKFSNPKIPPHIKIESRNIKYSKTGIANLSPDKEYCHITIADNGIGFEKEYSEKIFEVFQRLHSKEEYAGSGMGLAIVKKIVDNHNGFVTATSELKIGTTFNIYIPAL